MTQKEALEILKSGHNIYLTERPGIGMGLLNELDIASEIIRKFCQIWEPFGGLQIVLCGWSGPLPCTMSPFPERLRLKAYG